MTTTTTAPLAAARHVAPATETDREAVAGVLAAAFADDPVFAWIEPDPATRQALLPGLFAAFTAVFARHEATHLARVDDDPAGAALWAPPGVEAVHPDDAGILDAAIGTMAPAAIERTAACMEAFAAVHPSDPAWYLNLLGVAPDHQGAGIGSALLRRVLDRCDERGEPAYLEATSRRNRALYQRHGFRVIRLVPLPDGPTVYAMWRAPVMPPSPPWPRWDRS